eukprot:6125638-Pleurochrysis_carterae.AAC.2
MLGYGENAKARTRPRLRRERVSAHARAWSDILNELVREQERGLSSIARIVLVVGQATEACERAARMLQSMASAVAEKLDVIADVNGRA